MTWPKQMTNHTLWGRTYLYSPYKKVTPSRCLIDRWRLSIMVQRFTKGSTVLTNIGPILAISVYSRKRSKIPEDFPKPYGKCQEIFPTSFQGFPKIHEDVRKISKSSRKIRIQRFRFDKIAVVKQLQKAKNKNWNLSGLNSALATEQSLQLH